MAQREAVVMADLEETQENVKAAGADETASNPAVQQALLISCMQKIVIYETKAVSTHKPYPHVTCASISTLASNFNILLINTETLVMGTLLTFNAYTHAKCKHHYL